MFLGISTLVWAIIGGTGFLSFLGYNSWKAKKERDKIKDEDSNSGY